MRQIWRRRVLLLSHFSIIRAGLKQILAQTTNRFEIGEAERVQDAIQKIREENWGIVIVDFSTDRSHKLDLIKQLGNQEDGLPMLIISPYIGDSYVKRGLQAGAGGYLKWDEVDVHLLRAVEWIGRGEKYIDPKLGALLLEAEHNKGPPHECLSDREYQVLCQLVLGKRAVEIAAEMALSPKTICTYRKRIEEKMQLETYEEFVQYGRREGLVEWGK